MCRVLDMYDTIDIGTPSMALYVFSADFFLCLMTSILMMNVSWSATFAPFIVPNIDRLMAVSIPPGLSLLVQFLLPAAACIHCLWRALDVVFYAVDRFVVPRPPRLGLAEAPPSPRARGHTRGRGRRRARRARRAASHRRMTHMEGRPGFGAMDVRKTFLFLFETAVNVLFAAYWFYEFGAELRIRSLVTRLAIELGFLAQRRPILPPTGLW